MRKMLVALALGTFIAPAGFAQAAAPDVRGTWVGTSQSIVTGKAKHHAAPSPGQPLLDNVEFTWVIEGQDGHRFWGTLSSVHGSEALTGVVGLDGKSLTARTSEGEIEGRLVDSDTVEIIYSAGGPAIVLAVNSLKRRK